MSKNADSLIAKRYGRALFSLAGKDASVEADARALQAALTADGMAEFLKNPLLSRQQSAEVIQVVLKHMKTGKLLEQFVTRVALNKRLEALPAMLEQFIALLKEARGEMDVEIISAKPLDKTEMQTLTDALARHYGKTIHAQTRTDESLLGGIRLKIGDKMLDHSVAGKLARLAENLKNAPIHI